MREGAGHRLHGRTTPCTSLADGSLTLDRSISSWSMKPAWSAPTTAPTPHRHHAPPTKTVLVGDAHQLAPVKARGGMFAQLCDDLPWTQRLSEVWRMHDPQERSASLAVRDGGPAPTRRAISWYRSQDRLHSGDQIAMATDALDAHRATSPPAGRFVAHRHRGDVRCAQPAHP